MKIFSRLCIILLVFMIATPFVSTKSMADETISPTDIINAGDSFLGKASDKSLFNEDKEKESTDQLFFFLLGIGIVIAFFAGSVLAIQFMTSGAAGKAKVKEKLIPFIVGAFIVFGALGIWRLVYGILNQVMTP